MAQDMTGAKDPVAVDVLSLQARLDQIEAGIEGAHAKLDGIQARTEAQETPPTSAGAQDAAQRCQRELEELNQRLINVVELVGAL